MKLLNDLFDLTNQADSDNFSFDFPSLDGDMLHFIIFVMLLIKLILIAIIISLRKKNKRMTANVKWH